MIRGVAATAEAADKEQSVERRRNGRPRHRSVEFALHAKGGCLFDKPADSRDGRASDRTCQLLHGKVAAQVHRKGGAVLRNRRGIRPCPELARELCAHAGRLNGQ